MILKYAREGVAPLAASAIVRQHATDIRPRKGICIPCLTANDTKFGPENVIMEPEGKLETNKMNQKRILAARVSRRSFLSSLGAAGGSGDRRSRGSRGTNSAPNECSGSHSHGDH